MTIQDTIPKWPEIKVRLNSWGEGCMWIGVNSSGKYKAMFMPYGSVYFSKNALYYFRIKLKTK